VLNKWMLEEKKHPVKYSRREKRAQKFPVIGEPGAGQILLFSKLAPVAAVPSAFVGVPMRLWFGETRENLRGPKERGSGMLSLVVVYKTRRGQRATL